MIGFLRELAQGTLDLVYPPKCLVCGEFQPRYLCPACVDLIEPVDEPCCDICGHTLFDAACRACSGRPRSFTKAIGVGKYSGVLREAIHAFKYQGARCLADELGDLMYARLSPKSGIPTSRIDCIIPMPIHPVRQRLRGYNQSDLLAHRLSHLTGIPVIPRAISRTVKTHPQVDLSREARQTNVKGAFTCADPSPLAGKTVLLIDDVATTSSTIHECSRTILAGGADRVYVLCLALDE